MRSVSSYIDNEVLRKLVEGKGWNDFTLAQKLAIPKIREGFNVLLIAPTGYGKTEAAILPIFEMMLKNKAKPVAVIYITPLKALINDITRRLKWWADKLGFTVARKHGDVPSYEKVKRLRNVPHIIVTTPEGLEIDLDWAPKFRKYYSNVKWVIIDEVHELLSSKRGIQLSVLLERLKEIAGRDFQRIGLSATIGNPEVVAKLIFGSSKRKQIIINACEEKSIIFEIDSVNANDDEELWNLVSEKIVKRIEGQSLVFVNSRAAAERLHEVLEKHGLNNVGVHHSSVSKELRFEMENMLDSGKLSCIVCTKTLELGIDLGNISKIIQFQPPGSITTLLQRTGRSGHSINASSKGLIICLSSVDVLEALATVMLALNRDLEEPCILECPLDVLAKEILGMILQYGKIDPNTIYKIIKKAYPYRKLSLNDFIKLLNYLVKNGLICWDLKERKLKLGSMFFKIWRFNLNSNFKTWWMKSFSEFFTTIGERSSFQVKYGNQVIGDVDSHYVYRFLRVGDIFRLSGKNWKVVEIDDSLMKISVIPSTQDEAEIPIWRSGGIRRPTKLSKTMGYLLSKLTLGSKVSYENIIIHEDACKALENLVKEIKSRKVKLPDEKTMIVERSGNECTFLYWMGQNVAETLAHILLYLISTKYTLNVQVKVSHIGFSVKVNDVDPIKILMSIDPGEVEELVTKSLQRSPLYYYTLKELQLSFGKVGRIDTGDDVISEEATKQVLMQYMDIESTKELIRKIRNGEIKVVVLNGTESPLSTYVKKMPPIRPWIKDSTLLIIQTLEHIALTADELSEILEIPRKTIEHKLKELRKPGNVDRVTCFIDVDIAEWRWVLLRNIREIFMSSEYNTSFEPIDLDETFILYVKPLNESSYYTLYFTAREILNNINDFTSRIPSDEVYELRVLPLDNILRTFAPKYFYVAKKAVPYIALNGVTYLQIIRGYR